MWEWQAGVLCVQIWIWNWSTQILWNYLSRGEILSIIIKKLARLSLKRQVFPSRDYENEYEEAQYQYYNINHIFKWLIRWQMIWSWNPLKNSSTWFYTTVILTPRSTSEGQFFFYFLKNMIFYFLSKDTQWKIGHENGNLFILFSYFLAKRSFISLSKRFFL